MTQAIPDNAVDQANQAVALLIAYDTLAGRYVERNRLDSIPAGDMPRIIVSSDVDLKYDGMSPPQFIARLSLLVEAFAEDASKDGLTQQLDTLQAQIKDALLCDPGWVAQFTRFEDVQIRWRTHGESERYQGVVQVKIAAIWREVFYPRTPNDLKTITLGPAEGVQGPQVPPITINVPVADPPGAAQGSSS